MILRKNSDLVCNSIYLQALRHQVIARANGLCEYCQTQQIIVVTMEIDHIIPEASGGETQLDNLCYACISCNGSKLDAQTGIDPESNSNVPLYNPRMQNWSEHFQWSEDSLCVIGLTATGRATVNRLRMNRNVIVESRKRWVEVGWHPPNTSE